MNLTIAYVTSRKQPNMEWFGLSLRNQVLPGESLDIIVVDLHCPHETKELKDSQIRNLWLGGTALENSRIVFTPPKPTVWQGEHRLTKENWWAASNARNTGICLCKTDWIAFCDDRCVLTPTWLQSVRDAMAGNYCVLGSYEKRINMKVENGVIIEPGEVTGKDCREPVAEGKIVRAPGQWLFGCTFALPLEWALNVGGFPEDYCDGLSMEDVIFGLTLEHNNYLLKYNPSMKIIEDRTPSELGEPMKRSDKGVSPNDKSHKVLEVFQTAKTAMNSFDIRKVRESVMAGNPFPKPSASHFDWYDKTLIRDA